MTSTFGGSPKSEGRKKKVLEEVYLKYDKGMCMDLTKTKGQRWVGRQEENVIFRLPPKLMEKVLD